VTYGQPDLSDGQEDYPPSVRITARGGEDLHRTRRPQGRRHLDRLHPLVLMGDSLSGVSATRDLAGRVFRIVRQLAPPHLAFRLAFGAALGAFVLAGARAAPAADPQSCSSG
jgi:hypothetical protein